jgi:hypothetical protein
MSLNIPNIQTIKLDHSHFDDKHKILIFKILDKIPEQSIRKKIWEHLVKHEEEILNDLLKQQWYEDIRIIMQDHLNITYSSDIDEFDI